MHFRRRNNEELWKSIETPWEDLNIHDNTQFDSLHVTKVRGYDTKRCGARTVY